MIINLRILHHLAQKLHPVNTDILFIKKKINKLFTLDYEEHRIGPFTTNLILHGATGIVQCTCFDVDLNQNIFFCFVINHCFV